MQRIDDAAPAHGLAGEEVSAHDVKTLDRYACVVRLIHNA